MIEKNIFQLSKYKIPPIIFWRYVNTFKFQKSFHHQIYSDVDMENFILSNFPQYTEVYRKLPIVEKTDLMRLLLVYQFGGLYTDLDTYCRISISKLYEEFADAEFLVGLEADVDNELKVKYELIRNKQLCNWTFAAKKGNAVLKQIIDQVIYNIQNHPELPTLEKTGPGPFTDIILKNDGQKGLVILPTHYFCAGVPYESQELLDKGYIIHKFWGSWKKDVTIIYKIKLYAEALLGQNFVLYSQRIYFLAKKKMNNIM